MTLYTNLDRRKTIVRTWGIYETSIQWIFLRKLQI